MIDAVVLVPVHTGHNHDILCVNLPPILLANVHIHLILRALPIATCLPYRNVHMLYTYI